MNRGLRSSSCDRVRSRPAWWRGVLCAGVLLLGGCAANGDFGRVRPSLVSDDMHAWVGRDAVGSVRALAYAAPLTDDERLLRDLAYPLIEPPFDRNRWYSVLGEYGAGPARLFALPRSEVNPTAYWTRLEAKYRRSESSRYAQLIADARNDVLRIEPFFAVVGRVLDLDRKREQSLVRVSGLTVIERDNALVRNNENAAAVSWVCRSLEGRTFAYRYALEHLVIAAPSAAAVDAERTVNLLETRVSQRCRVVAESPVVSRG
jgi:hypothetical protein